MKTKLKICGIQSPEEAAILVHDNIDFIGLNFIPVSKRCINLETATAILNQELGDTVPVLLFANESISEVLDMVNKLHVTDVQLHGGEDSHYIELLNEAGITVIKSVPLGSSSTYDSAYSYITNHANASFYLLDREIQGDGDSVSLGLATKLSENYQIFLAGGIGHENIGQAITSVKPYAIDIASGVRDSIKLNLDKLNQVLAQIRSLE